MASRYAQHRNLDGCLHPITVFHHGRRYQVACGRCPACLVNRQNNWVWRLSDEIDAYRFSIFFTLTYNNYYVPKIKMVSSNGLYWPVSDDTNVRFNGVSDVLRDDDFSDFQFTSSPVWPLISQYHSSDYFAYSSKRDFQLYLKLLRKWLDDNQSIYNYTDDEKRIRYYAISEYGPLTYRPHIHGIFFTNSAEVAELLVQSALYTCWQMCRKDLFDEYTHFCDSGASGYLSSYLTSFNSLPQVLKCSKCFRPFRLSSKGPSVGFSKFDRSQVFEDGLAGISEYIKPVPKIDSTYVFQYPSYYLRTLFPRCFEYSVQPYNRLLYVYGRLYFAVVRRGQEFNAVSARFREVLRPIDYICAKRCYEFCIDFGVTPDVYLTCLDNFDYARSMFALKRYYEWQSSASMLEILYSYINLPDFVNRYYSLSSYSQKVLELFLHGFSIDVCDLLSHGVRDLFEISSDINALYSSEIADIMEDMVKTKKLNEELRTSPTFNY